MNKSRKMLPYLLICTFAFYIMPILDVSKDFFVLTVILFFPTICFWVSLFYGTKNGYNYIFSIIIAVFFVPAVFIHYNNSALIYVFVYGISSFLGNLVGTFIQRRRKL